MDAPRPDREVLGGVQPKDLLTSSDHEGTG